MQKIFKLLTSLTKLARIGHKKNVKEAFTYVNWKRQHNTRPMDILTWDLASCVQMVGKETVCTKYLKALQEVLVSSLILLTVFLVITTKSLSHFAEWNTDMIGSGRTLHSKGKDPSQMVIKKPHDIRTTDLVFYNNSISPGDRQYYFNA